MSRQEMKIATYQEGQLTVCRQTLLDQVFQSFIFFTLADLALFWQL